MKIGFLALSGVRVVDPELLALGLSLPGVVDRGRVIASLPSLGLLYLAAVTPAGHELAYFEAQADGGESPEVYSCDVVAISSFSAQIGDAYRIADRLRRAGVKVALGGLHVSVRPDEAFEHADAVIVGEGELIWPQAVQSLLAGGPRRIWNAGELPPVDVAELPVPRYDLLGDKHYHRFTVQTTRGCPWRCDFCASNVMLRQAYRKRPVEHVIRDIQAIAKLWKRPFIELADDNTFVDKAWGKELCRQLAPLGLNWFTETDASVADDPELLDLMRRSHCRQVLIGLESPEPTGLQGIELKTNFKARRWASNLEAVRTIQSHGITVNGCFILGLDGHTPDIFREVLAFALEAPLYDVQITLLTPFPGTPLYDRLLAEGRLLEPTRWELCTLFDVNYVPQGMTGDELRKGLYWLTRELYSEECLERRRRPYFETLARLHESDAAAKGS